METSSNGGLAARRESAETARRRVLEQHVELRQLLAIGLDHARVALTGEPRAHLALRLLVKVTYRELVRHLADEEALIVPILEDDLPLGPLRVAQLKEEHQGQRATLARLCDWPARDDVDGFVSAFRDLAGALLDDIEHEDRELLTAEVVRDDGIVVDQCGG